MTQLERDEIIAKAEKLRFKEYKPGAHEAGYERAWQHKIDDDSFVSLHWWNHPEMNGDRFELEYCTYNRDRAIKILVYVWTDFDKAWTDLNLMRAGLHMLAEKWRPSE